MKEFINNSGAVNVEDFSEVFEERLRQLYVNAGITIPHEYINRKIESTIGETPDADSQDQEENKYYRVFYLAHTKEIDVSHGEIGLEELRVIQEEMAKELAFKLFEPATLREPVGFLLKCAVLEVNPTPNKRNFVAVTYPAFRIKDYDVLHGEMLHNVNKDVDLFQAVDKLIGQLRNDEDYRRAWHALISMAFQDEYSVLKALTLGGVRDIANRAADRFLDNLTRVGK